jgi:hypothetical protein
LDALQGEIRQRSIGLGGFEPGCATGKRVSGTWDPVEGGHRQCRTQDVIEDVIFPLDGVISLVIELKGDMLETAMVGNDGGVGISCALDGQVSLNKAVVQTASKVWVIKAERLRDLACTHGAADAAKNLSETVTFH